MELIKVEKTKDLSKMNAQELAAFDREVLVNCRTSEIEKMFSANGISVDAELMHISNLFIQHSNAQDLRKAIRNNPQALYMAIYSVANAGLTFHPNAKHVFLMPRESTKDNEKVVYLECNFMYRAYRKIIIDGGEITKITPILVYEGEKFDVEIDDDIIISHTLDMTKRDGKIIAGYVKLKKADGTTHNVMPLTFKQLDKHRLANLRQNKKANDAAINDASHSDNSPAWRFWPEQMYLKSLVMNMKEQYDFAPQTYERLKTITDADPDYFDISEEQESESKPVAAAIPKKSTANQSDIDDLINSLVARDIDSKEFSNEITELAKEFVFSPEQQAQLKSTVRAAIAIEKEEDEAPADEPEQNNSGQDLPE